MSTDSGIIWTRDGLEEFLEELNQRDDGPELKPMLVTRFAGKKCFLLRNRKLRVSTDETFHGSRPRKGFTRAQLVAMRHELRKYTADPNWLALDEVIAKTGWTRERIAHFRRYCTYLGRKLNSRPRVLRLNKDGRLRKLTVHSTEDVERIMEIIAARAAACATTGTDTLSPKLAARLHGVSTALLRRGIRDFETLPTAGRGIGKAIRLDAKKVAEFVGEYKRRKASPVPPIKDDDGVWWPSRSAAEIVGCSVPLLEQILSGRRPSPVGVTLKRRIEESPRRRDQGYWLEGPLHALRKARSGDGGNSNGSAMTLVVVPETTPAAPATKSAPRKRGRKAVTPEQALKYAEIMDSIASSLAMAAAQATSSGTTTGGRDSRERNSGEPGHGTTVSDQSARRSQS